MLKNLNKDIADWNKQKDREFKEFEDWKQEEMKKEDIEITYSYWDGSGHRKSVMVSIA